MISCLVNKVDYQLSAFSSQLSAFRFSLLKSGEATENLIDLDFVPNLCYFFFKLTAES
jgi:hypothetical protein